MSLNLPADDSSCLIIRRGSNGIFCLWLHVRGGFVRFCICWRDYRSTKPSNKRKSQRNSPSDSSSVYSCPFPFSWYLVTHSHAEVLNCCLLNGTHASPVMQTSLAVLVISSSINLTWKFLSLSSRNRLELIETAWILSARSKNKNHSGLTDTKSLLRVSKGTILTNHSVFVTTEPNRAERS